MFKRLRWPLILLFNAALILYIVSSLIRGESPVEILETKINRDIKNVMAYSLLKQIEIDSENFVCDDGIFIGELDGEIVGDGDGEREWVKIEGTDFYVYSVYYDSRLEPFSYLRILGMAKGEWNDTVYCQTPTTTGTYHITIAKQTTIWNSQWNKDDTHIYYTPVLLSCQISPNARNTLTLNTNPCKTNGRLYKFNQNKTQKERQYFITVCVKPLTFPSEDISRKLMQWIVMIRLLGADKIDFYVQEIHQNMQKLLQWFENNSKGKISFRRFKSIVKVPANTHKAEAIWQKRRDELIPYNDCLYRNLRNSQFVIPLDVDEIIVPRRYDTWKQLILNIFPPNFASYMVRNAYYLDSFTPVRLSNVSFFSNYIRSEYSAPEESGKCFVNTDVTLTVFNHYALEVLKPGVGRVTFLPVNEVQMNHYKEKCDPWILPQCGKYMWGGTRFIDGVVFKYIDGFLRDYKWILKNYNKGF